MLTIEQGISHLDHGLTPAHLDWLQEQVRDRDGFYILTLDLPPELPQLQSALRGPAVGDAPIPESEVTWEKRGDRAYNSRLTEMGTVPTRKVTLIAGPHKEEDGREWTCLLYTAFPGPLAPKETLDPTLKPEEREASESFWAEHALSKSPE